MRKPGANRPETTTAAALGLAAAIMLVPANLLPVLDTEISGQNREDTIYTGVLGLWQSGLVPIAIIVFVASIAIPFLKLAGLGWLVYRAHRPGGADPRRLTRLYRALDFIGRWSMLDVFLAAFLTGLVRFGEISSVEARSGMVAFGAAVGLTILATRSFDPEIFWPPEDAG
jgi:paraquat-inducible protein A